MPKIIGRADGQENVSEELVKQGHFYYYHKTFTNQYQVLADSTLQTTDEIGLLTVGLPALGSPDSGCWCLKRQFKELATVRHPTTHTPTILWEVTCDFDNNVSEEDKDNQDPLATRPEVRWHGDIVQEVITQDLDGKPAQTPAGEQVVLQGDLLISVLEVKKIEHWPFDPDTQLSYANHTNLTTFYGAPKGTALMLPMEVDETTIENVVWSVVNYQIAFKLKEDPNNPGQWQQDTWNLETLCEGYQYVSASGPPPVIAINRRDGQPVRCNLDAVAGFRLAAADPPQYQKWRIKGRAELNNLNLGPF